MAKRIIWSYRAQQDRKEILAYWISRNKSKTYSIKLNSLFIEAIELLSVHPLIGKKTEIENVRIKIVRDYFITYRILESTIEVLTIWDSRQDPEKFREKVSL